MPQVVVTGASGFIAKTVIEHLKNQGNEIIAISRNPVEIEGVNNIQVETYMDIPNFANSSCIHLAEPNQIVEQQNEEAVSSAISIARSLLDKGFHRIVYASSAAVYGDSQGVPCTEDSPVDAKSSYTIRKLAVERIFCNEVVARISNVYGVGMSTQNVFSDILNQITIDGNVSVKDPKPIRDFIHVNDVAKALVKLVNIPQTGIYNVGTGKGTSIKELIEIIYKAKYPEALGIPTIGQTNICSEKRVESYLVLNVQKMEREIGWRHEVALESGIRQFSHLN